MFVWTIQQSYACDKCDDVFRTHNKLKNHEELKHRVKYECDKRDDASTTENKLKDHEELKHETVKYACNKCDDAFTTQNKLNDHEKLKYSKKIVTWPVNQLQSHLR